MVDLDDGRLKRLGMFFSEEKLERAKEIAENAKRKQSELARGTSPSGTKGKKSEDGSSSSSSGETLLENLTEDSRYTSLDSFQAAMRDKIGDIKVS